MKISHLSDEDLKALGKRLTDPHGPVTIPQSQLAGLLDEIAKHRLRTDAQQRTARNQTIEFQTILSSRTREGMVTLIANGEAIQMDIRKAKHVAAMLTEAIEAAVSDAMVWVFLIQRIGLDEDAAARALLDFRIIRQGSTETVNPS